MLVGSVCVSVKSYLTSGASVCPENTVTYSAGNGCKKICGIFSETAPLKRSRTALKCTHASQNAHALISERKKAGHLATRNVMSGQNRDESRSRSGVK